MRRAIAMVVTGVVLTGCASIPSGGPATEVVDRGEAGQSTVRYRPALPADGASPTDIVRGYLDAMLAYPASTQTVTAFMTNDAARGWRAQDGVVVYDSPRVEPATADSIRRSEGDASSKAVVSLNEIGRLDAAGRYAAGQGGRAVTFHLEQVDEQWRISDPPDGLLITSKFFDDYFRKFDVFYFDQPAKRLVAVPVHLPVDDRVAAALVASLAVSPPDHLRTFVPPAKNLRPTVPVVNSVAEVGFNDVVSETVDEDRLSAQVVSTLRQVSGLQGVSVAVNDRPLSPSGTDVQPVTSWQKYDIERALDRAFALRSDRVVRIVDDEVTAISGPWGRNAQGARSVAVSNDRLALLDRERRSMTIANLDGGQRSAVSGQKFLPPVVDADGGFWLVDQVDGSARVRRVGTKNSSVTAVSAAALRGLDISSFDISPDGARYVISAGSGRNRRIEVGAVQRTRKDRVQALGKPVAIAGATGGRSPVWTDSVRIAFLGPTRLGDRVLTALIDGSQLTDGAGGRAVLPGVDPQSLAVGSRSGADSYVTANDGFLWHLGSGGIWRVVDAEQSISSVGFGP